MCPKGWDPFQPSHNFRQINITTSHSGSYVSGRFGFTVGPETFYFSANASHVSSPHHELTMLALLSTPSDLPCLPLAGTVLVLGVRLCLRGSLWRLVSVVR